MTKRKIQYWVIPPEANSEFVANMEEVLETYARPYDAAFPAVHMDEQPVQLDLLSKMGQMDSVPPVVVMTAWSSVELIGEAMRCVARDFVLSQKRIKQARFYE